MVICDSLYPEVTVNKVGANGQGAIMPRTILVLVALAVCPFLLHAEESAQGGWQVTVTAQASPSPGRTRKPQCPLGIGACGGKCAEDGRKQWDCAKGELPCYQEGHCSCEAADMCKSTTAPPTVPPARGGINRPARQTPQGSRAPDNAQWQRFLSRLGL
jgi:hypothetical protein